MVIKSIIHVLLIKGGKNACTGSHLLIINFISYYIFNSYLFLCYSYLYNFILYLLLLTAYCGTDQILGSTSTKDFELITNPHRTYSNSHRTTVRHYLMETDLSQNSYSSTLMEFSRMMCGHLTVMPLALLGTP